MVRAVEKRVAAAVNHGFRKVIAPTGTAALLKGALSKYVQDVSDVKQLKKLLLSKSTKAPSS